MTPCDRYCPFLACPGCVYQGGVKPPEPQADTDTLQLDFRTGVRENGTAPGVASTNTGGLTTTTSKES